MWWWCDEEESRIESAAAPPAPEEEEYERKKGCNCAQGQGKGNKCMSDGWSVGRLVVGPKT